MKIINTIIPVLLIFFSITNAKEKVSVKYAGRLSFERVSEEHVIDRWSDSVSVTVGEKSLTSRSAYHNSLKEFAAFYGNVSLYENERKLTGDTLNYYIASKQVKIFHDILFEDMKEKLTIKADSAHHFYEEEFGKLFRDIELNYDDFTINCDSAYIFGRIDSVQLFGEVLFKKDEFVATTNLARLYNKEKMIFLETKPELKHEKSFLSGKKMEIYYYDKEIDSVLVSEYARGRVLNVDTLKNDTTITNYSGKHIKITIEKNELSNVVIEKNARIEYEYNDKKQKEEGETVITGFRIFGKFDDNAISRIKVIKGVEGKYQRKKYMKKDE